MPTSTSPVHFTPADDPEMDAAVSEAQATFRYFWREAFWEGCRIVPGLQLAAVKAPFWDVPGDLGRGLMGRVRKWLGRSPKTNEDGTPIVEHLWLTGITFDGETVSGTVLNRPNWLRSVRAGDPVRLPLARLGDWVCAVPGEEVCGAFSINLMRSRMDAEARDEHDGMWGLDFGGPAATRLVPDWCGADAEADHPMSLAMAEGWQPSLADDGLGEHADTDEHGWTSLHHMALAGSLPGVRLLLEHGADPSVQVGDGRTALDLADAVGWTSVAALLRGALKASDGHQ